MEIKMKIKVMLVLMVSLLLPGASHALTPIQEGLVGLKGVGVVVDRIHQPERLGLTRDQIKADVEQRLRKAGIMVLTDDGRNKMPGMPNLSVEVSFVGDKDDQGPAVSSIQVVLREGVTLDRGGRTTGLTWRTSLLKLAGVKRVREDLTKDIGKLVDTFIKDYLAANPRK